GALYRNEGEGQFRDVSEAAGFGSPAPVEGHGMGVVAADHDNDGDADLLITRAGTDLLYENRGDGSFGLLNAGQNAAGW
ncbi:MAG: VCBS repeat-containing protein, partial [Acidobacteria bacterium]|nr:VCBS repeat-containing protein [Acidobacteriota bacterium]